jgi:hypothetical protein
MSHTSYFLSVFYRQYSVGFRVAKSRSSSVIALRSDNSLITPIATPADRGPPAEESLFGECVLTYKPYSPRPRSFTDRAGPQR